MAGYMLPQLRVLLSRGRDIETHFRVESVGAHMENAPAVANGDADLATGTLADFKRFRQQFPGSHPALSPARPGNRSSGHNMDFVYRAPLEQWKH